MPLLDTNHQRASALILLLGIGLAIALFPYATGLIGIPVLYVTFAPLHRGLSRVLPSGAAAGVVVFLGVLLVLGPGASFIGLVATQGQEIASGVLQTGLLGRLSDVKIGPYAVGPQLAQVGREIVSWVGSSALGLLGSVTRATLNLTIAFFGLYFLLQNPEPVWAAARPYIPFSSSNAVRIRQRFRDVTYSTLIGTGAAAMTQGILVGIAFALFGLPNALFWGVVTAVLSILPVVGSGLIWGPGVVALILDQRYGAAIGLAIIGVVVVGNIDNLIRPVVYRRWAKVHPLVTLIGAFAGVRYFGLLGLLIGPLALSYFFELISMYREEYLIETREPTAEHPVPPPPPPPALAMTNTSTPEPPPE